MAEPWYPSLTYLSRDIRDIPHPDDSRYSHNRIRYGWSEGQQIWGLDYNANLQWLQLWWALFAHYRREYPGRRPPDFVKYGRIVLDPSQHTTGIPGDLQDCIRQPGILDSLYYKPFVGVRTHVFVDRMLVAYDGSNWRPMARLEKNLNVEIALFVSQPAANRVAARWVVDQPVRLFANTRGRCRNWSTKASPIQIRLNGNVIGAAGRSNKSSYASAGAVLEPGGILDLYCAGPTWGARNVAVSIIGTTEI